MAELNFGILDTQAPGRIAAIPQQMADQQAKNAMQLMQVQQAMGQNELAKYQLSSARRTDEETNKLRALYGEASDISDPNFIRKVYAINPEKGIALEKAISERADKKLTQTKTEGEIQAQKYKFFVDRLSSLSQDPSDAGIDRFLKEAVDGGVMSFDLASAKSAQLKGMGLPERQKAILGAGQSAKDALAALVPKPTPTNVGNRIVFLDMNPNSPTFQREVIPSQNIGVSPNTQATLAQAQQHFNGLSAYQKEQLRVQGKQFDSDRGVIVDVKNGTFEPVYSYPSSTPSAPAAPAAIPTAPIAAPAGTPITQPRAATAGTFPRDTIVQQTNRMEGATAIRRQELANEQGALANARQKLATPAAINDPEIRKFYEERLKEATNNIDALNKELGNQPAQPSATQPAQRTVLGPKQEKPRFDATAGGYVYPPSAENPQGKFVPVSGLDGKPLNESQGNATAYGLRMKEAEAILADLANPKIGDATLRGANVESIPFVGGPVSKVLPSFLGGSSEQQQQVNQAKTNFITAVLRKESGAAIGQDEFATEDRKYFPQLNDGPKVIKQKENARRLAIEAMKFQAGPGAKEIDKYVPSISREKTAPNLSEPPAGAVRVKAK